MKKPNSLSGVLLIIAILLPLSVAKAQDNFRGIIPLITTREDVEKKLGKPSANGHYELDEGQVRISYRTNECLKSNRSCFCLIPIGTVMEVSIAPNDDRRIEDLKLDPTLFEKKEVVGDLGGITAYINSTAGIRYEVRGGIVARIEYFESQETCKMLERKVAH